MAIGQDLLNVPMGDMIRQMAFAIADAQMELDESSVEMAELMSGERTLTDEDGNLADKDGNLIGKGDDPVVEDTRVHFGGEKVSLLELGFTPNFYQFIDTIIEVKIAIKITTSRTESGKRIRTTSRTRKHRRGFLFFKRKKTVTVVSSSVDGTYSSTYSYSAEGSSLLRTKLVPIPPPSVLESRIRDLIEKKQDDKEKANPPVT
ncbi:MAG: hypothetical protein QNK37_27770 [Acidobacteriota bacterium]|nr:hypothetical protein [Acidobacteriota bacterium]